jgi:hypothetical protein
MSWKEIKTQADADDLMARFGGFHDGCIREAHIWTDSWVSPDLSMSVGINLDTRVRFHIQRQWKDPMAIELLFEEVIRFNLAPSPENCDSTIIYATLIVRDGSILWAPTGNWDHDHPDCNFYTWISARKLKWREVDSWIGEKLRYGPENEG